MVIPKVILKPCQPFPTSTTQKLPEKVPFFASLPQKLPKNVRFMRLPRKKNCRKRTIFSILPAKAAQKSPFSACFPHQLPKQVCFLRLPQKVSEKPPFFPTFSKSSPKKHSTPFPAFWLGPLETHRQSGKGNFRPPMAIPFGESQFYGPNGPVSGPGAAACLELPLTAIRFIHLNIPFILNYYNKNTGHFHK